MNLLKPPDKETILTRDQLIGLLENRGIPWQTWQRTRATRSFDDMLKYHTRDQFYFYNGETPKFTVDVHVVVVRVHYLTDSGLMELYEERQVFPDQSELRRGNRFDGVGETRKRGEDTRDGALRCLREELNFTDPSKFTLSECLEIQDLPPGPSDKWHPHVEAVFHRYIYECFPSRALYNPFGYVHVEDGITFFFKWRPLRQLLLAL